MAIGNIKIHLKVLSSLFLTLLLAGCNPPAKVQNQNNKERVEDLHISDKANGESKIVFLTLNITLTDSINDTYRFQVVNTIFADGILKKSQAENMPLQPQYLYCEILDADKKRIDFIKVENPLFKIVEYNETPESPLQKKTIKSTTGEFVLRFQYNRNSKYLSIHKTENNSQNLKQIYNARI